MLFFKDIIEEKFSEPGFESFYRKECHICSVTMKIVSTLEGNPDLKKKTRRLFDISMNVYEGLKKGDQCYPKLVRQICDYLDICKDRLVKFCPKYKTVSKK